MKKNQCTFPQMPQPQHLLQEPLEVPPPKKVVPAVVTTSNYNEKHTLTSSLSGVASSSEVFSGYESASASRSAHSSGSNEANASGFVS